MKPNESADKHQETASSANTNSLDSKSEEIGNRWDFPIGLDSNDNLFPIEQKPTNTTEKQNNLET